MEVKQSEMTREDLLHKCYEDDRLSIVQIAKLLHMREANVRYHLVNAKIKIRSRSEALKLSYTSARRQAVKMMGANNPAWRGGKTKSDGYTMLRLPEHPRARTHGYVMEHIVIWEQIHNQPLPPGWEVHHLNGVKDDNRKENLVALPEKKHKLILAAKAQRIRELEFKLQRAELEIKSLHQAMLSGQCSFKFGGGDV